MYLQLISLLTVLLPYPKKELPKPLEILPKIKKPPAQDCVDARLRAGKCTILAKCPDIIDEFYDAARMSTYGIDFQSFIRNSICGFDGGNFLICCRTRSSFSIIMPKPTTQIQNTQKYYIATGNPLYPLYDSTPFTFAPIGGYIPQTTASSNNLPPVISSSAESSSSTTTPSTISYKPTPPIAQIVTNTTTTTTATNATTQQVHQPLLTLTNQTQTCGMSRGSLNRVVGGNEVRKGNYPWIAALAYRDEYGSGSLTYLCAGSLISTKYVITSAHCINSYLTIVRLGAHDLTNLAEPEARNYHIKRMIVHDKFDLKTISNDLALIELSETVVLTKFITTICLPDEPKFLLEDFVGMHPFVAGWGAKEHQGPTSNVLRDVQVPIISRQACEQSYSSVFNFVQISEMLICAGSSFADSCQGDSGGPLMMPELFDDSYHYYLIGVVSYGYECARTGFPGVYTKVAAYMPWIRSNMN